MNTQSDKPFGKTNSNDFKESITDIKVSFRLLKQNWKAFLYSEAFAIIAFVLFIFIISIILLFLQNPNPRGSERIFFSNIRRTPYLFILLGLFIFYAFISSQFGLAHDIILSGDMFTEFESSFTYFKKYFFKYLFLSLLILWIPLAIIFDFSIRHFLEFSRLNLINISRYQYDLLFDLLFVYLVQFLFFVIFNLSLASITANGKLIKSFKENFRILFKHPRRVITSWGLYFIIFSLPSFIIMVLSIIFIRSIFASLFAILGLFFIILLLSSIILGYPMMSLIATRIYTTTLQEESE